MSQYVSPAEAAKMIRSQLKAIGLGQKQVSVTSDSYSGGSSIRVRVKDTTIALSKVKAIAEGQERIDRCHMSGEILSGCNRYVTVEYDRDALAAAAAPLVPMMPAAMNERAEVCGFTVINDGGNYFRIVGRGQSWGASFTAETIVGLVAERNAS